MGLVHKTEKTVLQIEETVCVIALRQERVWCD